MSPDPRTPEPRTEIVLRRVDPMPDDGPEPAAWDLKGDADVVIGRSERCTIRIEGVGAAPEVARLRVVPEKADKRLLGTVREPAFVRFTPFWCDGKDVCREDPEAETALEFGNTIEVGSAQLRIERPPPEAPRTLIEKLDQWNNRLFEGRNPELRSRVQAARIFGSVQRRRRLDRHLAAVIHSGESAAARTMVKRSRVATEVAVPLMIGACVLAIFSTAPGGMDPRAAAILLLVTAIALILVCGGLFLAPIGGIVAAMMGLTVVELIAAPEDAATFVAILMIPTAWMVGRTLSFVSSPLPSEKRGQEAPFVLFLVLWPVLVRWVTPELAFPLASWAWVGLVLVALWVLVAVPLLRRRGAGEATVLDRLPKPLKRLVPAAVAKDVAVLTEVVWYQSRRRFATRLAAVLLPIAPALAILNSIDLRAAVGVAESVPADSTVLLLGSRGIATESAEFTGLLQPTDSSALNEGFFDLTAVLRTSELASFDALAALTPTEMEALAQTLSRDGPITVWSLALPEAGPGEQVEVTPHPLWATTPMALDELESAAWWTGSAMLALLLLGVAILWGAHRQGAVAVAAALMLIGSSYFRVVSPQPNTGAIPASLFPVHDLIGLTAGGAWETLAATAYLIVTLPVGMLGFIAPLGVLQGVVIAEWLISQDGLLGDSLARRIALRVTIPAALIAVLFAFASWDWAILLLPFAAALAYKAALFLSHAEGTAGLGHWALLSSTFLLPWVGFALNDRVSFWAQLGVLVATLVIVLAALQVFVMENTWGLGPAMAYLGSAWLLPVVFFGGEGWVSAQLAEYRVVPPSAAGATALFIFGLLLRPVFLRIRRVFDRLRHSGVAEVLDHLTVAVDELLKRATPDRRIERMRTLLGDAEDGLGLTGYGFYSRRGSESGSFECLVDGFDEGFSPPSLQLGDHLLEDLVAAGRGFVDVEAAADDERFSVTAPELWRLRRRLSHGAPQVRDRCRYVIPFHVGGHVFGLLVVAKLDDRFETEPLIGRLRAVGLAAS